MNREIHVRICENVGVRFLCATRHNAVMERFFLNLKMERVWQRDYANHGEAQRDIADYIVSFYNCTRLHSKPGYLPPSAYERKMAAILPIAVSENT